MNVSFLLAAVAKLKRRHKSMPVNPLLAQAMYLRGYIERVGSGTGDIMRDAVKRGCRRLFGKTKTMASR